MAEHTPTPWEVGSGDDYYIRAEGYPKEFIGHFKSDDNGPYVAYIGNRPEDFGEANAAFIVKAVNSHDELTRAVDVLEANARVQAKLLADTARQRDALVMALKQIRIVCHDNAATTVRHDLALEFVAGVAVKALDAVGGAKL